MLKIVTVFVAVLAAASPCLAEEDINYGCDSRKDTEAVKLVYRVGNWVNMYQFYARYAGCDYGEITDGISDRVTDLLVNHWKLIDQLADTTRKHPTFKRFVLGHVDDVMSQAQAKQVLDAARNQCPEDYKELCAEIVTAVLRRHQDE